MQQLSSCGHEILVGLAGCTATHGKTRYARGAGGDFPPGEVIGRGGRSFYVLGSGAVYVLDATGVAYSDIADEEANKTISVHDLRMHVISRGDRFDLDSRRPSRPPEREAKRLP